MLCPWPLVDESVVYGALARARDSPVKAAVPAVQSWTTVCLAADIPLTRSTPLHHPCDFSLGQVNVERVLVGDFMTALDMAGLSLSLLLLDDLRLARLDAPALAPAWPAAVGPHVPGKAPVPLPEGLRVIPAAAGPPCRLPPDAAWGSAVRHVLEHAAAVLVAAAPQLDALDGRCCRRHMREHAALCARHCMLVDSRLPARQLA